MPTSYGGETVAEGLRNRTHVRKVTARGLKWALTH